MSRFTTQRRPPFLHEPDKFAFGLDFSGQQSVRKQVLLPLMVRDSLPLCLSPDIIRRTALSGRLQQAAQDDPIAEKTGLSEEDVENALHELGGMVEVSHDCVLVKDELFASFDKFWKPWFPAEDALKIAADLLNDKGFPQSLKEIAERYEWEPGRINPAVAYLINRRVVISGGGIGTAPWLAVCIMPKDDDTRRFVRSQNL